MDTITATEALKLLDNHSLHITKHLQMMQQHYNKMASDMAKQMLGHFHSFNTVRIRRKYKGIQKVVHNHAQFSAYNQEIVLIHWEI